MNFCDTWVIKGNKRFTVMHFLTYFNDLHQAVIRYMCPDSVFMSFFSAWTKVNNEMDSCARSQREGIKKKFIFCLELSLT